MKKIFTLFAVLALGTVAYGQTRTIDLKVDSIFAPTEMNSTSQGTAIPINVSLRNVGTDTIMPSDSIAWNFFVCQNDQNLTIILGYPNVQNPNTYAPQPLTIANPVAPNDTFHFLVTPNTQLVSNASFPVVFIFGAHILNRTDGVNFETGTAADNNRKGSLIIWNNVEKWPVSVGSVVAAEGINVYPNPASNKVIVETAVKTANVATTVKVYDLNGKVVYTAVDNNPMNKSYEVNTSEFGNGVYFLEVTSGDAVHRSKMVVKH